MTLDQAASLDMYIIEPNFWSSGITLQREADTPHNNIENFLICSII